MSKQQHQWSYKQEESGIENGPIQETDFVALVKNGTIVESTLVKSSTRTKNKWVPATRIPGIQKLLKAAKIEYAKLAPVEPPLNPYAAPIVEPASPVSSLPTNTARNILEKFQPLRTTAVLWLLRATLLTIAINGFVIWCLYQFGAPRNSPIIIAQAFIAFFQVLLMIATQVFFLRWKYRAYANLQVACADKLKTTAGWCIGCYFIPILNWFRPPMAMYEIQARSKANIGLSVWVGWFLVFLWLILVQVKANTYGGFNDVRICILELASLSLLAIAAFLLLKIIRTVTEKQRRYRLSLEQTQPGSPHGNEASMRRE